MSGGCLMRHSGARCGRTPTTRRPAAPPRAACVALCATAPSTPPGAGGSGPSPASPGAPAGAQPPPRSAPQPAPQQPPGAPGPAAAAAAAGPQPLEQRGALLERRKRRVAAEIIEAGRKAGVGASADAILGGLDSLEALLPGFLPNLDTLKASDWARLAADAPAVASKIILLKGYYPRLDLARALAAEPRLMLQTTQQLERSAKQVCSLLARAKDAERLLGAVPSLLEPRALISVLITVTKWYHLEKDPIEVLEADPELVQRAQDYDVPFEPVYMDEDGSWTAPLLNYAEKRTEWQAYIDQTFYRQP